MTERDLKLLEYLNQFLTDDRKAQFEKVLSGRTKHFAVGLENIFQPHNANAVIRSCDCFGVQDIHIIESINRFTPSDGVSKGAIKWVDVYSYEKANVAMSAVKALGYQIVATSPKKDAIQLEEFDVSKKSLFFFGAEKKGLSDYIMDEADVHLHIPMSGHTESLNISVSAAIILQRLMAKLKDLHPKEFWSLSENELNEVRLAWAKVSTKRIEDIEGYFNENSLK